MKVYSEEQLVEARNLYGPPMGVAVMKLLDIARGLTTEEVGRLAQTQLSEGQEGIWEDLSLLLATEAAHQYSDNIIQNIRETFDPQIWGQWFERKEQWDALYQTVMAVFLFRYLGDRAFSPLLNRWGEAGLDLPEEVGTKV